MGRACGFPADRLTGWPWCTISSGSPSARVYVALRAALATLDTSRHTLIYLGNPSVGVRGINHAIVAALGGVPKTHHATLTPQAMDLLAREHAGRGRIPAVAIDEAYMLTSSGAFPYAYIITSNDTAIITLNVRAHPGRRPRRLPARRAT
jgi:hypothetical protein